MAWNFRTASVGGLKNAATRRSPKKENHITRNYSTEPSSSARNPNRAPAENILGPYDCGAASVPITACVIRPLYAAHPNRERTSARQRHLTTRVILPRRGFRHVIHHNIARRKIGSTHAASSSPQQRLLPSSKARQPAYYNNILRTTKTSQSPTWYPVHNIYWYKNIKP